MIVTVQAAASYALTGVKSTIIDQHQGIMGLNRVHSNHIIGNMSEPIIPKRMLLAFSISLDVKSVNIALNNNNNSKKFDDFKVLNHLDLTDEGIWCSIQQLTIGNLCEGGKATVVADLSGAQLSTFRRQSGISEDLICSEFRTHMLQSYHCIYEMSLTKLSVTLDMDTSHDVTSAESLSYNSETVAPSFDDPLTNDSSPTTACSSEDKSESSVPLPSSCCITLNFVVSDIVITPCLLKSYILEAHHSRDFMSSFSIKGLGDISGRIQVPT